MSASESRGLGNTEGQEEEENDLIQDTISVVFLFFVCVVWTFLVGWWCLSLKILEHCTSEFVLLCDFIILHFSRG